MMEKNAGNVHAVGDCLYYLTGEWLCRRGVSVSEMTSGAQESFMSQGNLRLQRF